MSAILCRSCNNKLSKDDFIYENKEYKTCNLCRETRSNKRRKHICDICGIKGVYNLPKQTNGIKCKTHKFLGMIDVTRPICIVCNEKRPTFSFENEIKPTHCGICRLNNMVSFSKKCIVCNEKQPSFNIKGAKSATHCYTCKIAGMENLKNKKCSICNMKQPSFNIEGETVATHCADCKSSNMVNVIEKKCIVCKQKRSLYNIQEGKLPTHCKDCKSSNMVNVMNKKKCIVCKKKIPSFNKESEILASHCSNCKSSNMVNVISKKKCIVCKKKFPSFNIEGEIIASYCADCKSSNMVNVSNKKKCILCKKKFPSFNIEGEIIPSHCVDCKTLEMVNIRNKKCIACNKKRPSFNFEGEKKASHCYTCKQNGMIDVRSKKCNLCDLHASYGYINQTKSRCSKHKTNLMFKKTKVKCKYENCNEISEYGVSNPIHCYQHKIENDLHLVGSTCKICNRENELCNNENICLTYCRPNELFKEIKKYVKIKEATTLAYLDKFIETEHKPIDDKIIDSSCVKRRPDRLYDCGSYFLIVEIDENCGHKGYYKGCVYDKDTQEIRRMIQIHEALSMGNIPCVFLRFNPDNFRVNNVLQKVNMQKRLDNLKKWVEYCLNLNMDVFETEQILIKYLYYDEYDETNIDFVKINDTILETVI
jgi:hypothetical protein